MNLCVAILSLLVLIFLALLGITITSLLTRLTADVESILELYSKDKAKDMADMLRSHGYKAIKKDEE